MRKVERVSRGRRLSATEVIRIKAVREAVEGEGNQMRARARALLAESRAVRTLCATLKSARESQGFTLGDIEKLTGIDRSALSKLERGERPNVTFDTVGRYAAALGKQIVVSLADAPLPCARPFRGGSGRKT